MVCSIHHEGVVNLEKARIRVTDNYEQSLFEPHVCQLCDPPECVGVCPVEALTQDIKTGIIIINDGLCTGCEVCVEACPYGAIRWDNEVTRLFVCDLCGGQPTCVEFCTSDALRLDEYLQEGK